MSRVLLLCSRPPWPLTGGDRVRAHRMARSLAERGPVDVVATRSPEEDPDAIAAGLPFVDRLRLPVLKPGPAAARAARAGLRGGLLQQALYAAPEAIEATAELARDADVVVAHLIRTVPWAPRPGPPLLVDLQDALSEQYREASGRASGWRGIATRVEARAIDAAERAAVQAADAVCFISARDRDLVLARTGPAPRAIVAGPCIDPVDVDDQPRRGVVFAGNLRTASNRAMADLLARRVWPIVRSVHRDAELRLVGVEAPPAVRRLGERPGVQYVGPVPDMAQALAGAVATACPLEFGSGVQNKILESLAAGTPVVLTPRAAGPLGTPGGAGTGLDVARLRRPFAERLVRLLAEPDRARRMGREGRAWVARRYSADAAFSDLFDTIDALASPAARAAQPSTSQ